MELISIVLKVLCIFLYIFNIAPLLSFFTFCLLQQSARNILSIGNASKPNGIANQISNWYLNLKKHRQAKNSSGLLLHHISEEVALYYAIFIRFIGVNIGQKYTRLNKNSPIPSSDTPVLTFLYPKIAFKQAPASTPTPTPTPTASPHKHDKAKKQEYTRINHNLITKRGFAEHFIFMVYQNDYAHTNQKKDFSSFEVTLQLGNCFRLKVNLNTQILYALSFWIASLWYLPIASIPAAANFSWISILSYPINWFSAQTALFKVSQIGFLFLTYTAAKTEDFLIFFFGHDPKSANSHLMSLDFSGQHILYSVGTILVNIIANGLFFLSLFALSVTPVNLLSLLGTRVSIALVLVTLIDRMYYLAQENGLTNTIPITTCATKREKPDVNLGDTIYLPSTQGFAVPKAISRTIQSLHCATHKLCHPELFA
ncbi:MAG: hypothetical protein VXW87_00310 [Pseudomonadota bacterium]|nr:hypothetical protein [Pseudomonadota bacterium]